MALDLERMMILMQRRFNSIREIHRLTEELAETCSRNDQVSASMLLKMRGDELVTCDACIRDIWELAENGGDDAVQVRRLMKLDISQEASQEILASLENREEKTIYEIRRKTGEVLEKIHRTDRMINQRVGGKKSFYNK